MRKLLTLLVLVLLPLAAYGQYDETCVTSVENATVVVPYDPAPQLPTGEAVAEGDTISVYTKDGVCAGYTVVKGDSNVALAAAGKTDYSPGFEDGEYLKFRVFDVSEDEVVDVGDVVTYASCDTLSAVPESICGEGAYSGGTIHKIDNLQGSPIPVELASFSVQQDGSKVQATWRTLSETNVESFQVLGSTVQAKGSGQYSVSSKIEEYGTTTVELWEITTTGQKNLVDQQTVELTPDEFVVSKPYPNPSRGQVTFKTPFNVKVTVFDLLGREVATRAGHGKVQIEVPASGKYFVVVKNEEGKGKEKFTFMVNK